MTTTQFNGVTVNTQASVYFDGKCVSHSLTMANMPLDSGASLHDIFFARPASS